MKNYFYIYEVIDGKNRLGNTMKHWEINQKANSKKEILQGYNRKGYARRVKYIYTSKEFIETFPSDFAKKVLAGAIPYAIK